MEFKLPQARQRPDRQDGGGRSETDDPVASHLVAASLALPVLVAVIVVSEHHARWPLLIGAAACLVAAMATVVLAIVLAKPASPVGARPDIGFLVTSFALAALGFLGAASVAAFAVFLPAALVGVAFVAIIGDRRMRGAIGVFTLVLVGGSGWAAGLRGRDWVAALVVYGAVVAVLLLLAGRTAGTAARRSDVRRSVASLRDALWTEPTAAVQSNRDLIQDVFRHGLPLTGELVAAESITVFARNTPLDRMVAVATWPDDRPADPELGDRPELARALRIDDVVVTPSLCVIPVGFCAEGALVMVIERAEEHPDPAPVSERAGLVGMVFLRAISRANASSGLQVASRVDPLTGLANRRVLHERIQIEMEHAIRSELPLSVAMVDLDHFQDYNNRNGLAAGDTVLRSIAAIMVSNVRGQDVVVRCGGQKFCLVMPDTDILGGHHILDTLRGGGRDATSEFGVTLSAGLTSWDGIEDTTSLIERADDALRRAKSSGRDRVVSIQSVTEF